jgi:hypothetical protein
MRFKDWGCAYGISDSHSFHAKVVLPFLFFTLTLIFSTLNSFLLFNFHSLICETFSARFFGMFRSSPSSLKSFFPVFKGGIGLVSTKIIALVGYLGSYRLVALIITSICLQDDHPFLLGL